MATEFSTENPEISFLVTSYNFARYFGELFESISWMNDQKIPYEVVFIDDGSVDETNKLVEEIKAGCLIQNFLVFLDHHKGVERILERFELGVVLSRGKYIVPISADDFFDPVFFLKVLPERSLDCLTFCNGYEYEGGNRTFKCTPTQLVDIYKTGEINTIFSSFKKHNSKLWLQGSIIPKCLFDGFNWPSFDYADDWSLVFELLKKCQNINYRINFIDECGFLHRKHERGTSANHGVHRERVRLQREYIYARLLQ